MPKTGLPRGAGFRKTCLNRMYWGAGLKLTDGIAGYGWCAVRQAMLVDRELPDRNSSTVRVYGCISRERRRPRTAATTFGLRRSPTVWYRAGRSAIVSGLPSGPMTYFTRAVGFCHGVLAKLETTELVGTTYPSRLKIYLNPRLQYDSPRSAQTGQASPQGAGPGRPVMSWLAVARADRYASGRRRTLHPRLI